MEFNDLVTGDKIIWRDREAVIYVTEEGRKLAFTTISNKKNTRLLHNKVYSTKFTLFETGFNYFKAKDQLKYLGKAEGDELIFYKEFIIKQEEFPYVNFSFNNISVEIKYFEESLKKLEKPLIFHISETQKCLDLFQKSSLTEFLYKFYNDNSANNVHVFIYLPPNYTKL